MKLHVVEPVQRSEATSHPAGVRGLKRHQGISTIIFGASHPAGVRGLKPIIVPSAKPTISSHPAGVRGLKPANGLTPPKIASRTPQGCVD